MKRLIRSNLPFWSSLAIVILMTTVSPRNLRAQSADTASEDVPAPETVKTRVEAAPCASSSASTYVRPAVARLLADVSYLADDRRGGRRTGYGRNR